MNPKQDAFTQAEGFFELGLFHDAWEELDKLETETKSQPGVLRLRLEILIGLGRWDDAVALGVGCCRNWRDHPEFFIKTAAALMRLDEHAKAMDLLKHGPPALHEDAEYHYALARCASQLGNIGDAKLALQECFDRDKSYRHRGLDDPDLQPVWLSLD
jgi:predicted Zn-dependent protease